MTGLRPLKFVTAWSSHLKNKSTNICHPLKTEPSQIDESH